MNEVSSPKQNRHLAHLIALLAISTGALFAGTVTGYTSTNISVAGSAVSSPTAYGVSHLDGPLSTPSFMGPLK